MYSVDNLINWVKSPPPILDTIALKHSISSAIFFQMPGSGMNYKKKGLNQLLEMILQKKVKRLVITHKDRLLRFGSEFVFALCELQNIEIVIIHCGEQPSFEEELTKDVLEIITVFSARLYGSRSHKNKKLIDGLKDAVTQNEQSMSNS